MAQVFDQVTRHRANRVRAEAAAVVGRAEKEIDAGGAELLVGLLVMLDHPGHVPVDEDREHGDALVLATCFLEHMVVSQPAPPALDLGIRSELDDPFDIAFVERSEADAISA